MKAGGDHAAADPIASGMITGLRRAEISDLITRKAVTEEEEEVELSLGLSVGGSKRKAGDFLRNRIPTRNRNPNPDPIVGVPMYVPVVNGSGFPCLVPCQPLANPNPNPNGREIGGKRRVRMKREPSLSGSVVSSSSGSLRGSIGNSGETQSNSNPITADLKPKDQAIQEVISKPTILAAVAPPLPVNQTAALDGAKADQMPCVMTKGPNGETISGFLYRYSKSEVSIVCVCHGTSFSPAGFVRHAGGKVSPHPLRQIVVVPSCALELTL